MSTGRSTTAVAGAAAKLLVVGCGNRLRGDDGAGPECVRLLAAGGVPPGTAVVDAGTGGVDVVLSIRGASLVIFVDASRSGLPPGSLTCLSAADLSALPETGPCDLHAFGWLDALRLTRALAGEGPAPQVSAWLVEGADFAPGDGLSPPVAAAVARLVRHLRADLSAAAASPDPGV